MNENVIKIDEELEKELLNKARKSGKDKEESVKIRLDIGKYLIKALGGHLVTNKNKNSLCWVKNNYYFEIRQTQTRFSPQKPTQDFIAENKWNKGHHFLVGYLSDEYLSDEKKYVLTAFEHESEKTEVNTKKDFKVTKEELVIKVKEVLGLMLMEKQLKELIRDGNKQIIFTGAPGTGKTYTAKKYVIKQIVGESVDLDNLDENQEKEIEKHRKFVQFHASYDYTDFVEGLRPVRIERSDNPTFVRIDGIFKEFCRTIVENNNKNDNIDNLPNYYFIIDEINRADLSKVFGELMFGLEESYRGFNNRFHTQYKNLKTYKINKEGYAKQMEFDCFEEGFFVPKNLIIIGTMNDIDRSVEAFDFALRRRFRWVEVDANTELDGYCNPNDGPDNENTKNKAALKEVRYRIEALNKYISGDLENVEKEKFNIDEKDDDGKKFNLNKSYQIGHAYFMDYNGNGANMVSIWKNRVEPILKEYCRGRDAGKFIENCNEILIPKNSAQDGE